MFNKKQEIHSLTGLRFVAAFYVFLFHIHIRWPLTKNPLLKGVLDVGAVGMTVFFVLSGFILVLNYRDIEGDIRGYFINRIARIYPIYLAAAFLTLPWMNVVLDDGGANSDCQGVVYSSGKYTCSAGVVSTVVRVLE